MTRTFKSLPCLAAFALFLGAQTVLAGTDLDWVSSLPGVSSTASKDRGDDLSRVYTVRDVRATYASLKRELVKRGWSVRESAGTEAAGTRAYALTATKDGRELDIALESVASVISTMALHVKGGQTLTPSHAGLAAGRSAVPSQSSLVLNDEGVSETYSVNGPVTVNGDGCKLTIGGEVTMLTLNSDGNKVAITGPVHRITINGNGNQIHWPASCQPKVTDNGSGNAASAR